MNLFRKSEGKDRRRKTEVRSYEYCFGLRTPDFGLRYIQF